MRSPCEPAMSRDLGETTMDHQYLVQMETNLNPQKGPAAHSAPRVGADTFCTFEHLHGLCWVEMGIDQVTP